MVNGGRVQSWNKDDALKFLPLVHMTVMCLGRESAELMHLPYEGGFLEQPARTMEAVAVVQKVFGERLRKEYEKSKKGVRRG